LAWATGGAVSVAAITATALAIPHLVVVRVRLRSAPLTTITHSYTDRSAPRTINAHIATNVKHSSPAD
jgi:hypothetical protein